MRKLLFYAFWILIALALPYSIKAQTEMPAGTPEHSTHVQPAGVESATR